MDFHLELYSSANLLLKTDETYFSIGYIISILLFSCRIFIFLMLFFFPVTLRYCILSNKRERQMENRKKHPWTSCSFAQGGHIARVLELGEFLPSIWLESDSQIYRLSKGLLLNWACLRSNDIIYYSSWKPESVIRQSKFKANNFGSLYFEGLPKEFQIQTFCQWLMAHLGGSSCCEEQERVQPFWFIWPNGK